MKAVTKNVLAALLPLLAIGVWAPQVSRGLAPDEPEEPELFDPTAGSDAAFEVEPTLEQEPPSEPYEDEETSATDFEEVKLDWERPLELARNFGRGTERPGIESLLRGIAGASVPPPQPVATPKEPAPEQDPFARLAPLPHSDWASGFVLRGIVHKPGTALAFLDGRVVREGDEIAANTFVERIEPRSIRIAKDGMSAVVALTHERPAYVRDAHSHAEDETSALEND